MPPSGATSETADPAAHTHRCLGPDSSVAIDLHTARRNVTLRPHKLIARRARPRALDLLEIAAVTLMTDIAARRGANEAWIRDLHIRAAVREPAYWEGLAEPVERIVRFLTGDNVRLTLEQRPEPAPGDTEAQVAPPDADCVCLLSGGIDSFAGAAALLKASRIPLLVSHASGSPSVDEAQRRVIASLQTVFDRALTRLDFFLGASRLRAPKCPFPTDEEREPSQRSRAFFFLAAAVAAADAAGVQEIYACENGILASHLPPTRARIGSLSTRSNHPQLLAKVAGLATEVLGREVVIMNPFQGQTKAEVIRDVLRPEVPIDAIQRTVSCWQVGRAPRPCGGCIPCLVRRIAMLAAGLPDEAFMIDVLADPLAHRDSDAFANLMELLMLAADFRMGDDGVLLRQYPELVDGVGYGAPVAEVANVYRRFADEVYTVVGQHSPATAQILGAAAAPER